MRDSVNNGLKKIAEPLAKLGKAIKNWYDNWINPLWEKMSVGKLIKMLPKMLVDLAKSLWKLISKPFSLFRHPEVTEPKEPSADKKGPKQKSPKGPAVTAAAPSQTLSSPSITQSQSGPSRLPHRGFARAAFSLAARVRAAVPGLGAKTAPIARTGGRRTAPTTQGL
jgi:hypothetical protein